MAQHIKALSEKHKNLNSFPKHTWQERNDSHNCPMTSTFMPCHMSAHMDPYTVNK